MSAPARREGQTGLDRRQFITASFAAGVGLVVGSRLPLAEPAAAQAAAPAGQFAPNPWIRIAEDGAITVMSKTTELGQGTTTSLAMLVAEELEADWAQVRTEVAPAHPDYKNPAMGVQATGGSTGLKTAWEPMRLAAAATREMLIAAAAARWGVPKGQCRAESSTVLHGPSGRSLAYKDLLADAAKIDAPDDPPLKKPSQFKIVGQPFHRLDARDKARGRTVYGMDLRVEGMLHAAMVHAPLIGGRPGKVDAAKVEAMPGVRKVVKLDHAVAVVAHSHWQALRAAQALEVEWQGGDPGLSDASIMASHQARMAEEGSTPRDDGDVAAALAGAARRLKAVYKLPYQAHACPEPMNCIADVRPDSCQVWAPTQGQGPARAIAARLTGLDIEAVQVYTPYVGGGFGRRFMPDFVIEAVTVSQAMGAPVKVVWTREEDMRNDMYRPCFYNEIEAGLDQAGLPVAWRHKAVGQSQMAKLMEVIAPAILPLWIPAVLRSPLAGIVAPIAKRFLVPKGELSGSADMAYAIANVRTEYIQNDQPVPVASWRSVGDSRNAFVKECFMDEIAAATGQDPVELRLKLLQGAPDHKAVLEMAADKAGWGRRLPDGVHQGVAVHAFHGTPVCMVAEVSVEKGGRVKVHRVVCAVDCGIAVNPKLVKAQLRGGVLFGLTATLLSQVHIAKGAVRESNFHDFPIITMAEAPPVEVYIRPSTEAPRGIGEVGVPPIAPAVANAVFAATGKRLRSIPIDPADLA